MLQKKILRYIASFLMLLLCLGYTPAFAKSISTPPDWIITVEGGPRENPIIEPEEPEEPEIPKKKEVKIPILLYHHVTDDPFQNGNEISLISPADFRLHMTAIKANFTPISLRQYYDYVNSPDENATLPKNPIIVTFDDGYSSNYELAYPILKQLEIPATIFVVTDTVGARAGEGQVNYSHFTWEEAREMEASGLIEIHSHTASHQSLSSLDYPQLVTQLRKSKYMLDTNLGHPTDMIAFPFGDYNQTVLDAARAAGYKLFALVDNRETGEEFSVNLPSEGIENLTRMTVAGTMGNVNVIEIIRQTMAKKVIPAETDQP